MRETDQLRRALDHEFPLLEDRPHNWDDVLRRVTQRPPKRRLPALRIAAAIAAVAGFALVVTSPWRGAERVGILERALAAVGDGPVLHVVLRFDPGVTRVDLSTGKREPLYGETEYWYDADRRLLHEIRRFGGAVEFEWVSRINRPLDDLNVLNVLSRDYRESLEDGTARVIGKDVIEGIPVYWISVLPPRNAFAWQVAISQDTFKPVEVRGSSDGKPDDVSARVLRLETVSTGDADLDEAEVTPVPTMNPVGDNFFTESGSVRIPLEDVAKALGRTPLWLGREYGGLPLADSADRIYIRGADGNLQTAGVALHYALPVEPGDEIRRTINIVEATDPRRLPSRVFAAALLKEGSVVIDHNRALKTFAPAIAMSRGDLVRGGVYVSIQAVGPGADEKLVIAAAEALRPMPSDGSGAGG